LVQPASSQNIFRGRWGLFIGGFLAAVPFLFKWSVYNWYGFAAPVIILAIPALEVTQLIIIRIYKGIPPTQGSPDHFSLYLQASGWGKETILSYVFMMCCVLSVVSFFFLTGTCSILSTCIMGISFLALWIYIIFAQHSFKKCCNVACALLLSKINIFFKKPR
jgi:hypothetical protein